MQLMFIYEHIAIMLKDKEHENTLQNIKHTFIYNIEH